MSPNTRVAHDHASSTTTWYSGGVATGNDVPGMASEKIHDLEQESKEVREHERERVRADE